MGPVSDSTYNENPGAVQDSFVSKSYVPGVLLSNLYIYFFNSSRSGAIFFNNTETGPNLYSKFISSFY